MAGVKVPGHPRAAQHAALCEYGVPSVPHDDPRQVIFAVLVGAQLAAITPFPVVVFFGAVPTTTTKTTCL